MALSNVLAPGKRADRPPSGVSEQPVRHPVFGNRPGADQPVFRLKQHGDARREIIGHKCRNADAEIDQHPRAEFLGNALGNDGLRIHKITHWRRGSRRAD